MKQIGQMMKQAQAMQAKMGEIQAKLEQTELTGNSGAGMVEVTLSGKGDMRRIKIDKSLADPNDVEMLEDLIVAAFNDARAKSEAMSQAEMSKLTAGLPLPPGMKLPF